MHSLLWLVFCNQGRPFCLFHLTALSISPHDIKFKYEISTRAPLHALTGTTNSFPYWENVGRRGRSQAVPRPGRAGFRSAIHQLSPSLLMVWVSLFTCNPAKVLSKSRDRSASGMLEPSEMQDRVEAAKIGIQYKRVGGQGEKAGGNIAEQKCKWTATKADLDSTQPLNKC